MLVAQTTRNARVIRATPERLYQALTTPAALETWQAPGKMVGKVHQFDLREGGGYTMSLYYPEAENEMKGKTAAKEDRFTATFVELTPTKIVQAIRFDTVDRSFSGEMIMEITLAPVPVGTNVTFLFKNLPDGIRPEDNEAGTISSLEKLAQYVE
jgi:uncharacterized protein YndB with AHSA1/START domain